jgi:hypothetical protein
MNGSFPSFAWERIILAEALLLRPGRWIKSRLGIDLRAGTEARPTIQTPHRHTDYFG